MFPKQQKLVDGLGEGALPYANYMGIRHCEGYGFQAV